MAVDIVLAYLHHAAMVLFFGALWREFQLCRPSGERGVALALAKTDLVYFGAALGLLLSGLGRLTFGAMPADFYLGNPVFHAKMGLFLLVGVMSAWPTMRFMRWRKRANTGIQPSPAELEATRKLILVELCIAALIPLLAVLMVRGVGR
ncbi:MAG: DUF2214 family protein [Rhodocyclaceae bacterium]